MKKSDAEKMVRHLVSVWKSQEKYKSVEQRNLPSHEFLSWLQTNHAEVMNFRSVMPVREIVELWFDQETRQTWRN